MAPSSFRLNSSLLFILMVDMVVLLIVFTHSFQIQEWFQTLLQQIEALGSWGPIVFMAIYSITTVLFIPGSLLTLGGGALFGVGFGSIYVFSGAVIGATLAFLMGRYWMRGWVAKQIEAHAKFKAIDQAIATRGFKIVALTRLSPIFPFNLLNYGLGVTQVSLKDYLLGFVGMIPGTVLYVYIGSLAGSLASLGSEAQSAGADALYLQWAIRLIGLGATIAVTLYISRIAKQALDQAAP